MSIYNRKMFKRNARNALNSSAGVQNFFNGGQINVRGRIPGARPVFASQAARVGGPSRSFGVMRDGRVFTFQKQQVLVLDKEVSRLDKE